MQSAVLAVIDSVCPSVTVRYHIKTTQATIMGSSMEDSPMTIVSSWLIITRQNSKGTQAAWPLLYSTRTVCLL